MSRCVSSGRPRGRHVRSIVASLAAIALVGPVDAASAQTPIELGYGNPGTGKQVILPTDAHGGPSSGTPSHGSGSTESLGSQSLGSQSSGSQSSGSPTAASSAPVAVSAGTSSNGVASLPFTGLDLAPLLLVGLGVLGLGIGLRRMTSRTAPHSRPRG